jgi:bacterioferritin (cytochrome b1)
MSRATPAMLGWLQRALRHEFAAARQFTLQAVVARELGDSALAGECEGSAVEELRHAQRFASALAQAGAPVADGAVSCLPVGRSVIELLQHARTTEAAAVRLYRDAARACQGVEPLRRLFELIGAEEATHYDQLTQRLARSGERIG